MQGKDSLLILLIISITSARFVNHSQELQVNHSTNNSLNSSILNAQLILGLSRILGLPDWDFSSGSISECGTDSDCPKEDECESVIRIIDKLSSSDSECSDSKRIDQIDKAEQKLAECDNEKDKRSYNEDEINEKTSFLQDEFINTNAKEKLAGWKLKIPKKAFVSGKKLMNSDNLKIKFKWGKKFPKSKLLDKLMGHQDSSDEISEFEDDPEDEIKEEFDYISDHNSKKESWVDKIINSDMIDFDEPTSFYNPYIVISVITVTKLITVSPTTTTLEVESNITKQPEIVYETKSKTKFVTSRTKSTIDQSAVMSIINSFISPGFKELTPTKTSYYSPSEITKFPYDDYSESETVASTSKYKTRIAPTKFSSRINSFTSPEYEKYKPTKTGQTPIITDYPAASSKSKFRSTSIHPKQLLSRINSMLIGDRLQYPTLSKSYYSSYDTSRFTIPRLKSKPSPGIILRTSSGAPPCSSTETFTTTVVDEKNCGPTSSTPPNEIRSKSYSHSKPEQSLHTPYYKDFESKHGIESDSNYLPNLETSSNIEYELRVTSKPDIVTTKNKHRVKPSLKFTKKYKPSKTLPYMETITTYEEDQIKSKYQHPSSYQKSNKEFEYEPRFTSKPGPESTKQDHDNDFTSKIHFVPSSVLAEVPNQQDTHYWTSVLDVETLPPFTSKIDVDITTHIEEKTSTSTIQQDQFDYWKSKVEKFLSPSKTTEAAIIDDPPNARTHISETRPLVDFEDGHFIIGRTTERVHSSITEISSTEDTGLVSILPIEGTTVILNPTSFPTIRHITSRTRVRTRTRLQNMNQLMNHTSVQNITTNLNSSSIITTPSDIRTSFNSSTNIMKTTKQVEKEITNSDVNHNGIYSFTGVVLPKSSFTWKSMSSISSNSKNFIIEIVMCFVLGVILVL
ncbi:hypothetical protein KGF54_001629 [Candida jiufengensis]|uniref:uncharacterized protein n=1 Tax=Candida jiufengensis TaxID=497108 RepID=UPI002225B1F1|nr:uncharacterized protein KGF54_001629 [Candida jiufengensis]KAI5955068.1 hypothetical protein KGF54_001629 [Candida jiufengensis]